LYICSFVKLVNAVTVDQSNGREGTLPAPSASLYALCYKSFL